MVEVLKVIIPQTHTDGECSDRSVRTLATVSPLKTKGSSKISYMTIRWRLRKGRNFMIALKINIAFKFQIQTKQQINEHFTNELKYIICITIKCIYLF